MSHLTNPTDDDLNAAFAEHVAGWVDIKGDARSGFSGRHPKDRYADNIPSYCDSVDAVLPYLETESARLEYWRSVEKWAVHILPITHEGTAKKADAADASLPRAIALLRSKGHTVEFTS